MVARRKTVLGSCLARRVLSAAFLALLCLAPVAVRAGDPDLAYTLQISNSYIGLPGSTVSSGAFGGGSVLEQWIDESRPFVRITNITSSPTLLNLFGAQLDLTRSASLVTEVEWVEGLGAPAQTWNWNADLTSAFFQFHTPLAPGESVLMRLSTAPRPGLEDVYTQNQQLFHPIVENCLCNANSFGSVSLFSQTFGSTVPVDFLPSGQPAAPNLHEDSFALSNPLTPAEIADPNTVIVTPVVVPVPEPSTVVLAASAVAFLAVASRCRSRLARVGA
jgi:hypothetical protein